MEAFATLPGVRSVLLADEPLIDASARDGQRRQPVGMGDVASPLIGLPTINADLKALVTQGILGTSMP